MSSEPPLCECCEERPQVRDAICDECFKQGLEALEREAEAFRALIRKPFRRTVQGRLS